MSMSCLCGHGSSLWLLVSFDSLPLFSTYRWWCWGVQTSPSFFAPQGSPVSSERPVDSGKGRRRGQLDNPCGLAVLTDVGALEVGNPTPLRWDIGVGSWTEKKEEERGRGVLRDQWPGHSVQLGGGGHRPRARWPSGDLEKPPTEAESSS